MHPLCFQIGAFRVHWFGVMMALGFFAGLLNWSVLGRPRGRDFNACSDLLFWIMVAGIAGARLAYVASDPGAYLQRPAAIFRVDQGGLIYYGGVIGAAAALVVYARRRREPVLGLFDFVVTSLPLAHAFGRVGCFLNGCCHGRVWNGPWAVRFPPDSLAWWEQVHAGLIDRTATHTAPVHPVQLYEAAYNLALYALLAWAYRRRPPRGAVTGLYLAAYPLGRFLLEFLRGDERLMVGALNTAQAISLGLCAAGAALLAWSLRARAPAPGGSGTADAGVR